MRITSTQATRTFLVLLAASAITLQAREKPPEKVETNYVNDEKGFSLTYPPRWMVGEKRAAGARSGWGLDERLKDLLGPYGQVVGLSPLEKELDSYREKVMVDIVPCPPGTQPDKLLQAQLDGMKDQKGGVVNSTETASVAGLPAKKLVVSSVEGTAKYMSAMYFFVKGRRGFVITCLSTQEGFERNGPLFANILASFKVKALAEDAGEAAEAAEDVLPVVNPDLVDIALPAEEPAAEAPAEEMPAEAEPAVEEPAAEAEPEQ